MNCIVPLLGASNCYFNAHQSDKHSNNSSPRLDPKLPFSYTNLTVTAYVDVCLLQWIKMVIVRKYVLKCREAWLLGADGGNVVKTKRAALCHLDPCSNPAGFTLHQIAKAEAVEVHTVTSVPFIQSEGLPHKEKVECVDLDFSIFRETWLKFSKYLKNKNVIVSEFAR